MDNLVIETGKELIEGVKMTLNGVEYTIPTLGGKAYRVGQAFDRLGRLNKEFQSWGKTIKQNEDVEDAEPAPTELPNFTQSAMDDLYTLIYYAFERNYPEVTPEWVDRQVDLDSAMELFPVLVSNKSIKAKEGLKDNAKNAQKQSPKTAK